MNPSELHMWVIQMTFIERRKHIRIHSLNLAYICLDEKEENLKQGMGRTLNVSEAGLLLETHFPLEPKQILSLTIGLEEDLVEIKGRVIYSRTGLRGKFETGIRFLEIDETADRILNKYVNAFREQNQSNLQKSD